MKCALNKIIKTVQNDTISGYGDRLVMIYDISCEILKELEKMKNYVIGFITGVIITTLCAIMTVMF